VEFVRNDSFCLIRFIDLDWAVSLDDMYFTYGYVFKLGSREILWTSKKQATIALSSIEVEYKIVEGATCEVVWLRRIMQYT
jgi:hypothetical protein